MRLTPVSVRILHCILIAQFRLLSTKAQSKQRAAQRRPESKSYFINLLIRNREHVVPQRIVQLDVLGVVIGEESSLRHLHPLCKV